MRTATVLFNRRLVWTLLQHIREGTPTNIFPFCYSIASWLFISHNTAQNILPSSSALPRSSAASSSLLLLLPPSSCCTLDTPSLPWSPFFSFFPSLHTFCGFPLPYPHGCLPTVHSLAYILYIVISVSESKLKDVELAIYI